MTQESFTTKDIVEKLGIPMQRLRMWLLEGYIVPSTPSEGQGKKAYFTRNDLYAIRLFTKLMDKGFKREAAAVHAKEYQDSVRQNNIWQYANYMVFVTIKTSDDETAVKIFGHAGVESVGLQFEPAKIKVIDPHTGSESEREFVWEDTLVINFGILKGYVDAALRS